MLVAGEFTTGVVSAGIFSAGVFIADVFSVGIFSLGVFSLGSFRSACSRSGSSPLGAIGARLRWTEDDKGNYRRFTRYMRGKAAKRGNNTTCYTVSMAMPNLQATRFGDLTFEEVRSYVAAESLAIIPTGCTEQQGPHLSVDFDTWFAETLALAAAQKAARDVGVSSVVLPALPFGPTPEHRGYGTGYIHLPAELHAEVVAHALRSLAEQGFKKLLVWRGCGGHDLDKAVKQFNKEWLGRATAFLPGAPFYGIWCRVGNPDVPVGHADSFTTSVALHLRPESVRVARIKHSPQSKVDWSASNLDFSQHSLSGVIGDPTYASAELGQKLWEETVAEVAKTIQEVYER